MRRGYSSAVEHATYDQVVPGSNPRPGEAAKAGSGNDLCSCPDDKPQNSFLSHPEYLDDMNTFRSYEKKICAR